MNTTNTQDPIKLARILRTHLSNMGSNRPPADEPEDRALWDETEAAIAALQPAAAQPQGDAREALRRIKYEAVSLADAQVIALEALQSSTQANEPSAERENQNGLFQTSPFQTAHSPEAAQVQQQAALQAGLASKAQPHDAPPDETGAAQSVGHATLGKAVRPGLSVLTRQPDEPIGIVRYTSTDRCVVDWLGELPRAGTQIYAAPARAVEPLMAQQVHEVAVVVEQLEDNEARIRWIFNPVPEGEYLLWNHSGIPATTPTQAAQGGDRG